MRIGLLFLVCLTVALPLRAEAWKSQPYRDSIIELRTGWGWTAPEDGKYWVKWTDDFTTHRFAALWSLGTLPRITVMVERLAPQMHWKGSAVEYYELDEQFLKRWNYLKQSGVSEIVPLQCEAHECVTFTAGGKYGCGAFMNWSGQLNDRNDTDIIGLYYCANQSIPVAAERLKELLTSIHLR